MTRKIVVITGPGAGIGRAAATEFARRGCDLAVLSRDLARLDTAARELRPFGVRVLTLPTDTADAAVVDEAARQIESRLGPIDIWVNVAMATVFAPVHLLTPEEIQRGTAVTYLGQVYGTMAALRYMRPRNRGTIVCVGSALAYRAVPLQGFYCEAKFAIRGFIDSLRSELIHDGIKVHVAEVDLPAVNTPQFDWARNKTGRKAQRVPPIYQPEVAARAICFAAFHPRRQVVGRLPGRERDPRESHCAGVAGPLPGPDRLFRSVERYSFGPARAGQSVRTRAWTLRGARTVLRSRPRHELGDGGKPPSQRAVGGDAGVPCYRHPSCLSPNQGLSDAVDRRH